MGHPLCLDADGEYRGSIVNLSPGTRYEVEAAGMELGRMEASTLSFETPKPTRTLYVALSGDDAAPGTAEQPFRSISHAASVAEPGDEVLIGDGTYHEQVNVSRSGSTEQPIVFRGAAPGRVFIDGEGERDHAVRINGAKHIAIRHLALQNTKASCLHLGAKSSDVIIDENVISDPGYRYYDSAIEVGNGCSNVTIRGNRLLFNKGSYNGNRMGISLRKITGGVIICSNTIAGNGLIKDGIGGEQNFEVSGGPHRDSDIYNNTISGCKDDGIEAEGGGINVRIWGNRVSDCLVGIAVAPVIKGPTYVWRNQVVNCGPAFKLGEGDHLGHGPLFIYHNSVFSGVPEDSGYAGSGGKGLFQHVRGRNNLFSLNGRIFYDNRQQMSNSFDYDLLHTRDPKRFMAWGKGNKITLEDAQALGFWRHGIAADPLLADPPDDLSLRAESQAIDAGEVIPNFNDDFSGDAPDIGALERR